MRPMSPRIKCKRDAVCHKLKWYHDDVNVILNMVTYCVSILIVVYHCQWVSYPAWNSHVAKRIPVELMICFYHCARGKPRARFTIRVSPFTQKPIACRLQFWYAWLHGWGIRVLPQGLDSVLLYGTWPQCCWATGFVFRCWDSHSCFHRHTFHSLSVWCVLILFEEGGCQPSRLDKRWG